MNLPMDGLTTQIAQLFADVLQMERIHPDDNFFDAGGHSLLALKLLATLEAELALRLPVISLFEHSSPARMAAYIRQRQATAEAEFVGLAPIRRGSASPALFLVPGGRGGQAEITLYAKVMQHLPTDRAVWGLLADGLNDVSQPLPSSVATMAAVYIDRLRQVQTQGPYALAGECIGGVVAYEMAQQLQAQGQQVALLLLMDCWRPSGWRYWHYRLVQSPRQRWQTWRHWLKLAGSDWYKALVWRIQQRPPLRLWQSSRYGYLVLAAQAKLALAWWRSMTRPQLEDISAEELAARRVGSNYLQQTMRYRPRPCGAPLHVLMSEANVARGLAKDWQALARRGCHLWVAPGDHQTYLRETPEQAAILLTHCLDTAFSQATGD